MAERVRTGSDSDWVLLRPVKIRQFVTLFVGHIVAGFPNTLFVPQISLTSFVSPRRVFLKPQSVLSKLPCRIGFQCDQGIFRLLRSDADNYVNVVGSNIYGEEIPVTFGAKLSYRFLDGSSTRSIEYDGRMKQQLLTMLSPVAV